MTALAQFIQPFITPKGCTETNIIDQCGKTYNIPQQELFKVFDHLLLLHTNGTICHYSERQMTASGGIMIDLDILSNKWFNIQFLEDIDEAILDFLYAIDHAISNIVIMPQTYGLKFYIIAKKESVFKNGKNKYGLHILVPNISISKKSRKMLLEQIKPAADIFGKEFDADGEILDMASTSVPVLFLGSCKRGVNCIYTIHQAYKLRASPATKSIISLNWALSKNIVYEMSLNRNLILDRLILGKPTSDLIQCEDPNFDETAEYERCDSVEEIRIELSTLAITYPEIISVQRILDLLTADYYTDRNKWRDVIYSLANTKSEYRLLAHYFSKKCPDKYSKTGS